MAERLGGDRAKSHNAVRMPRLLAALALLAGLMAGLSALAPRAEAASLLQKNFWLSGPDYSGDVPRCDEPRALDLIAQRFAETERMYWHSELAITGFDKVYEIAFRPWGQAYQPRRYCGGRVFTTDNHKRAIYYSIIEDGGFIGWSWGVEWCIVGLDRNYAYAPSCKMARP